METQMITKGSRTWAEIDLDAAAYNMNQIRADYKCKNSGSCQGRWLWAWLHPYGKNCAGMRRGVFGRCVY